MQKLVHLSAQSILWLGTILAGLLLPGPYFAAVGAAAGLLAIAFASVSMVVRAPARTLGERSEVAEPVEELAELPGSDPVEHGNSVENSESDWMEPADVSVQRQLLELIDRLQQDQETVGESDAVDDQLHSVRLLAREELRPRLERLKNDTKQIQNDISRAYDISDNLTKTASTAFELAAKVQKGVENINSTLKQSLQNTQFLGEQSQKISGILDLMGDISSQIQVLSMNASIVSARAGVHGKGFEVVAKEIRKLSHQTEDSLKEIAASINEIQHTITTVGEDTQQADTAAADETKSLMSVAGSLQGVQLAVEVVHAVSTASKDRIQQQAEALKGIEHIYDRLDVVLEGLTDACGSSEAEDGSARLLGRLKDSVNEIFRRMKDE